MSPGGLRAQPAARPERNVDKLLAISGFGIGAFALILQFALTIPARMEAGHGLGDAMVFYFSFFTILTNFGVALVYAAACSRKVGFFRHRFGPCNNCCLHHDCRPCWPPCLQRSGRRKACSGFVTSSCIMSRR